LLGLCLASTVTLSGGCASIGPRTVPVDRFDYSEAVSSSWKQQILLNIVKLRYMDMPAFLDVSSIVAGYSLQTGVSVNGVLSSERAVQGNYASVGGSAIYTDRPTITYVPMTGDKFLGGLITPIDPKNIFALLQAGYAADFILGLTVESINGVRNRSATGGTVREADVDFIRALGLLREVQAAGGFAMRVEEDKAKGSTMVLIFQREDLSPGIAEKSAEARRLLKLPQDEQRVVLVHSPMRGGPGELAINSRSMLQIMQAFASYMDAPDEHIKEHSVVPGLEAAETVNGGPRVRIRSGKEKPTHAFASVHYRDYWYWVDDGDLQTKRSLTAVMFFFTLAETGPKENVPVVTIPAQ
jgi:hypothetical protein